MERRGFITKFQSLLERIHLCLQSISVYTITFICIDESQTKTTIEVKDSGNEDSIDEEMTNYLTEKKAINWCRTTCKMAALRNNSRGRSSLLRAVSKSIWGVDDRDTETFLQQLMNVNLSSARESARFKERWENEIGIQAHTNRSAKISSWEEVCRAFKDDDGVWDERTSDVDSIHIFTMANIIKRPVIVNEVNEDDEVHATNDGLGGLYLPSLMDPDKCFKSPIILAYRNGRFNPIVVMSDEKEPPRTRSVTLISHKFEQFQIRNLANEENQQQGIALLRNYLKIEEIPCTGPVSVNLVLVARLICFKPERFDTADRIKNSETSYTQIRNETRNMSEVCGYTAALLESSGLRCSDPMCSQPVDREYYPKCRMHGSSKNSPSGENEGFFVRTSSEITPRKVDESRNAERSIAGECVVSQCKRKGAMEYEGKCHYCYVAGSDVSMNESMETSCESGGLKSSDELAREGLNGGPFQNGGRNSRPFHSETEKISYQLEEARYERQISEQPKCTAPICENIGLTTYNGLCIECFNTIWKEKETNFKQKKEIQANTSEVTSPAWTRNAGVYTRFVATKEKCLTDGCHSPVDNLDLGLCKSCSNQQRQIQEAFERQKRASESRRSPAFGSPQRQQTTSEAYGAWLRAEDLSLHGQPLPGQPKLQGAATQSKQRRGTSLYPSLEETTRAKMCLSSNCDRFGDAGYGGFCSVCYVRKC